MADIDIVTLEVLSNYLFNIAEEMGVVLVKTSYSTNIKERRDSSAALLTVEGETLAQAENVPLHLGSMLGLVEAIRVAFPEEEIDDGDVFIANDPYAGGGTHLPDITVAAPFFQEGKLVAWVADIAHHAEVGGARGGPVADIYEEGLRISPLKLIRAGKVDQPLMDMILLNCRIGRERVGDIQAQLAALSTGRT
ncbi:MAG: hydantoinase B/oxoprolinase family protein, partial [Nitrospinota bacterium]|nr:hydantoinase B/oxoprolinase family protein [Nitrospinota bacterium]